MLIKSLLYFDMDCWNVDQRSSVLWYEFVEMLIKGFSTLICTVACKKSNLELDFNWWVFCCSFAFGMGDFYLFLLDLNFIKKSLIDKRFYFWETFDFWNLEVLKFSFKISRLWNFEILYWNLEFEIWNFEI